MRRAVQYALGFTLALTVFALCRPATAPAVVDVIQRNLQVQERPSVGGGIRSDQLRDGAVSPALPAELPSALPGSGELAAAAGRDFFVPVTVQAKPVAAPPPVVAAPVVETPLPAPVAPAMTHRFLGRMVSPTGETLVYLASGGAVVSARVGERLDSGYIVESVNNDSVLLVYPPLDARVAISLPMEAQP